MCVGRRLFSGLYLDHDPQAFLFQALQIVRRQLDFDCAESVNVGNFRHHVGGRQEVTLM